MTLSNRDGEECLQPEVGQSVKLTAAEGCGDKPFSKIHPTLAMFLYNLYHRGEEFLRFLTVMVDIAYIATGIKHHDSCTKGRSLPYYLIFCGSCDLMFTVVSLIPQTSDGWDKSKGMLSFSLSHSFAESWKYVPDHVNFFLFAAGNALIYSIHEPDYDSRDSPEFCDRSLYLFALYTHLTSYAVYLVITFCNYWQDCRVRRLLLRRRTFQTSR